MKVPFTRPLLCLACLGLACAPGPRPGASVDTPPERVGGATPDRTRRKAYLGIIPEVSGELPPDKRYRAKRGIAVGLVAPDSPAWKAGLLRGDVLVAMDNEELEGPEAEMVKRFRKRIERRDPGDVVTLLVYRKEYKERWILDGEDIERPIGGFDELGAYLRRQPPGVRNTFTSRPRKRVFSKKIELFRRRIGQGPKTIPLDEAIHPQVGTPQSNEVERIADKIVEHYGLAEDYADLRARLAELEETGDPFRRDLFAYVHRNPFRTGERAEALFERVRPADSIIGSADKVLAGAYRMLDLGEAPGAPSALAGGLSGDGHLRRLLEVLDEVNALREKAFSRLTGEELAFLRRSRDALLDVFEKDIYLHADDNLKRFEDNKRIIELAARVDHGPLLAAARELLRVADPEYLRVLREDLERDGKDVAAPIVTSSETPYGKIVIAGTADDRHRFTPDSRVAVLIDLGGDDFYADMAAASTAPVAGSLVVDAAGDDSYEAATRYAQGSGVMGVGVLADLGGDDSYVCLRACQGSGYLGVGLLLDAEGRDSYRSHAYSQGTGFFGVGALLDLKGDDRYDAHRYAQAVGIAGGLGLLVEAGGDDRYYSKGTYPTGYGTPGVFDAWSQACGLGIRYYASGGLALLYDGGGSDRMEAGNFSQGGGYYFGWGMLKADGDGGDTYIGSRYAHGFSAHYAGGTFLEGGGDDAYLTRNAVAAGLAWDLSLSWFEERGGNDRYPARSFSLGASAHNSIAVWIDRGGGDRYVGTESPARSGPNDYHGGTSLSLAFDLGGGEDVHAELEDGAGTALGEYGFFFDLPGGLGVLSGEELRSRLKPLPAP